MGRTNRQCLNRWHNVLESETDEEANAWVAGGGAGVSGVRLGTWLPEQWPALVPHHPHCEQHSPLVQAPFPLLPPPQVPRGGQGVGGGGAGAGGVALGAWPPEQWPALVPQHHPHCKQHSPLEQTPSPLLPPPQFLPRRGAGVGGVGVGLLSPPSIFQQISPHATDPGLPPKLFFAVLYSISRRFLLHPALAVQQPSQSSSPHDVSATRTSIVFPLAETSMGLVKRSPYSSLWIGPSLNWFGQSIASRSLEMEVMGQTYIHSISSWRLRVLAVSMTRKR
jgi:hypothetical protein